MVTGGWVAIGHEAHPWTSRVPADLVSRRVRESHTGEYRAAVLPPVAHLDPVLPLGLLAEAERAAGLVTRFDAESAGNPVPFSALLLRSESASSSQIENITSGARALAVAALDAQDATRNAGLVLGNVRAMERAIATAELDAGAVLAMHRDLLAESAPDHAGTWRREQVWIGGSGYGPHQAEFVPPHHDAVPAAIEDLMTFAARRDVPALVHAALVHAQFETVHPFVDGNGRTGRALVHVLLRRRGLVRQTVVPVSAGLLRDGERYVAALTAYRAGDVEPIVRCFTAAAEHAVVHGRELLADLADVRERWRSVVRARQGAAAWSVLDLLFRQPVLDVDTVAREVGVSTVNAAKALATLTGAGVVVEFSGRRRDRRWQAPEILSALDEFARRAGRRA
ncbi:Fic family protein [Kineococcus sp. SYSU DK002]|uniref:Fic family protein n=1 Tax=Kineococcus sp. SYSU DK002 TaxID=3383123 RepID=UPI003D7C4234